MEYGAPSTTPRRRQINSATGGEVRIGPNAMHFKSSTRAMDSNSSSATTWSCDFDHPWLSLSLSSLPLCVCIRVYKGRETEACVCIHVYWRRQWHPTPLLLPGKSDGRRSLEGYSPWGRWGSDTTERLHFHFPALEKEMATHSSVLAWRIPGTGEPGWLPSLGSQRVGHDWSDLAAVAAAYVFIHK